MALRKKESLSGMEMLRRVVIDQSDTIQLGDLVNLRNGNVEVHTADGAAAGVVVALLDKNGASVFGSLAVLGSATISGSEFSGSVTVASDNETVDLIAAVVDISPYTVYSADVTGTMNTTSSSNKIGGWVNMADEENVDETTFSRTINDTRTLYAHGVDPDDTSRMLVSIRESEVWSYGGTIS